MSIQYGTPVYGPFVAGGDDQDDVAVAFGDQLGRTILHFDSESEKDTFTQTYKTRLYKSWAIVKQADNKVKWYAWNGTDEQGEIGIWIPMRSDNDGSLIFDESHLEELVSKGFLRDVYDAGHVEDNVTTVPTNQAWIENSGTIGDAVTWSSFLVPPGRIIVRYPFYFAHLVKDLVKDGAPLNMTRHDVGGYTYLIGNDVMNVQDATVTLTYKDAPVIPHLTLSDNKTTQTNVEKIHVTHPLKIEQQGDTTELHIEPNYYESAHANSCLVKPNELTLIGGQYPHAVYMSEEIVPINDHFSLNSKEKGIDVHSDTGGQLTEALVKLSFLDIAREDFTLSMWFEYDDPNATITSAILHDVNGKPLATTKHFSTGDELGSMLLVGVFMVDAQGPFKVMVETSLSETENIVLDHQQTLLCLNQYKNGYETSLARIEFMRRAGVQITPIFETFTDKMNSLAEETENVNEPEFIVAANTGFHAIDRFGAVNLTELKFSILDGVTTFSDTGAAGINLDFYFELTVDNTKTQMLRSQTVTSSITLANPEAAFEFKAYEWRGEGDKPTQLYHSRIGGSEVISPNYHLIKSLAVESNASFQTKTLQFVVPETANNIIIVIMPQAALLRNTLKLKEFTWGVTQDFTGYLELERTLDSERHLLFDASYAKFILTNKNFDLLRYTINNSPASGTPMPLGWQSKGKAPIEFDHTVNKIYGTSVPQYGGAIKFLKDGQVNISKTYLVFNETSTDNQVTFFDVLFDHDGNEQEIPQSKKTFSVKANSTSTGVSYTIDYSMVVQAGQMIGGRALTNIQDGAYIETTSSTEFPVMTDIVFDEFIEQNTIIPHVLSKMPPPGFYTTLRERAYGTARPQDDTAQPMFNEIIINNPDYFKLGPNGSSIRIKKPQTLAFPDFPQTQLAFVFLRIAIEADPTSEFNVELSIKNVSDKSYVKDYLNNPVTQLFHVPASDKLNYLEFHSYVNVADDESEWEFYVTSDHIKNGFIPIFGDKLNGNTCFAMQFLRDDYETGEAIEKVSEDLGMNFQYTIKQYKTQPVKELMPYLPGDWASTRTVAANTTFLTAGGFVAGTVKYPCKIGVANKTISFDNVQPLTNPQGPVQPGNEAFWYVYSIIDNEDYYILKGKALDVILTMPQTTDFQCSLQLVPFYWKGDPDTYPKPIVTGINSQNRPENTASNDVVFLHDDAISFPTKTYTNNETVTGSFTFTEPATNIGFIVVPDVDDIRYPEGKVTFALKDMQIKPANPVFVLNERADKFARTATPVTYSKTFLITKTSDAPKPAQGTLIVKEEASGVLLSTAATGDKLYFSKVQSGIAAIALVDGSLRFQKSGIATITTTLQMSRFEKYEGAGLKSQGCDFWWTNGDTEIIGSSYHIDEATGWSTHTVKVQFTFKFQATAGSIITLRGRAEKYEDVIGIVETSGWKWAAAAVIDFEELPDDMAVSDDPDLIAAPLPKALSVDRRVYEFSGNTLQNVTVDLDIPDDVELATVDVVKHSGYTTTLVDTSEYSYNSATKKLTVHVGTNVTDGKIYMTFWS